MKFLHKTSSLVSKKEFMRYGKKLLPYVNHLRNEVLKKEKYDASEASLYLLNDVKMLEEIKRIKKAKARRALKYIIVVGIGGSNLGAKAIYDARFGAYDTLEPNRFPKMIFADTNDPEFSYKLQTLISKLKKFDEVLINIISKSGTTAETMANAELLANRLSKKFKNFKDRIVVTTDVGSKLWILADKLKISRLGVPEKVGGRFSVFSAVGLFPLAVLGFDITELLHGARLGLRKSLNLNILQNPAMLSASILYFYYKNGKNINDNFVFHGELESLAKWYRQLMGESIGKEKDLAGETVRVGITPTISIGSTDLHSVGQLYLGGPKDKLTTFIATAAPAQNVQVSQRFMFKGLADNLAGKSFEQIMDAILQGVKIAYKKHNLPFMEVVLDDLSLKSLGEFLQFKMLEIMYLGKLLNINAFDQPNVELYKLETKRILKK